MDVNQFKSLQWRLSLRTDLFSVSLHLAANRAPAHQQVGVAADLQRIHQLHVGHPVEQALGRALHRARLGGDDGGHGERFVKHLAVGHHAVPAIVMANLVRQVGRKAAYELVALGEKVPAARALALGMVNRVVPDGQVLDEALAMAAIIAAQSRPVQRATKRLFHRVADMKLMDALEIGRDANLLMRGRTIRSVV